MDDENKPTELTNEPEGIPPELIKLWGGEENALCFLLQNYLAIVIAKVVDLFKLPDGSLDLGVKEKNIFIEKLIEELTILFFQLNDMGK